MHRLQYVGKWLSGIEEKITCVVGEYYKQDQEYLNGTELDISNFNDFFIIIRLFLIDL